MLVQLDGFNRQALMQKFKSIAHFHTFIKVDGGERVRTERNVSERGQRLSHRLSH